MLPDIFNGGYAYLGWKNDWIILFGFESSFIRKDDVALVDRMRNANQLLTDWIEPPSIMDNSLGDFLLTATKASFQKKPLVDLTFFNGVRSIWLNIQPTIWF